MADFIDKIKNIYKQGSVLVRFLFINIFVFLVLSCLSLISKLFYIPTINPGQYLAVSSGISDLLYHPWTLFTYMFVHYDLWHILFNMIFLYGFGRLFLQYFMPKTFGSLYVLGGLGGAILYILIYNTVPYFIDMGSVPMVGASASAMAIVFGVAFYVPQTEVNLLLFGKVKLIYIAIALFLLDFLLIGIGQNSGGHIAHIGGAAVGYLFAKLYGKGKDITKWMSNLIDNLVNLFKKSPRSEMKIKHKRPETDRQYNARKTQKNIEIDQILDKIKKSGYTSLNAEEKRKLFDASQN